MQSKYSKANTEFGLNLLRAAFNRSGNADDAAKRFAVQVSPFSTRRGITMAGIGARGATRQAILDTLCIPSGVDFREINEDNQRFVKAILAAEAQSEAPTELLIANALWLKQDDDPNGYQFRQAFVDENVRFYDAAVERLPFGPETLQKINDWCKAKTKEKIEKILEEIPDGARAFLTDALYIKTPALKRFRRQLDEAGNFTLLDGTVKPVTFMQQYDKFRYFEGDEVEVLEFPFGENGVFNFYLVLPAATSSLVKTVSKLDVNTWLSWKAGLEEASGRFRIAQNEQEWGKDVAEELIDLGMGVAFSDELADFLDMCTQPLKIGAVNHKTYTKFTHKGFEGAAITCVGMVECLGVSVGPSRTFDITVDRPYAWFVEGAGEILFAGTTTEPTEPKEQDTADDDEQGW